MYHYKVIPFNRIIFLDKKKKYFYHYYLKLQPPEKLSRFQEEYQKISKKSVEVKKTVIMAALANSILYYN